MPRQPLGACTSDAPPARRSPHHGHTPSPRGVDIHSSPPPTPLPFDDGDARPEDRSPPGAADAGRRSSRRERPGRGGRFCDVSGLSSVAERTRVRGCWLRLDAPVAALRVDPPYAAADAD